MCPRGLAPRDAMPEVPRPALLDGSFHHHLLRDEARTAAWAEGVRRAVRPGDVVADVGSGSGILAWVALQAGAERVFAVEQNTHSYQALLRHVRRNGVEGRIVPVLADGTQWRPPRAVDIVVCELMETGLLHESIGAVMRNVRAWDAPPRAIVPKAVSLRVEGVEARDEFLGWRASFSGWRADGADPPLTDLVEYAAFDFEEAAPPERVEARVALRAQRAGTLGGLQLRTLTTVAPGVEAGESPAYCTPLVLALDEPIQVEEGERLAATLSYELAYTAEPIRFDVRRA